MILLFYTSGAEQIAERQSDIREHDSVKTWYMSGLHLGRVRKCGKCVTD